MIIYVIHGFLGESGDWDALQSALQPHTLTSISFDQINEIPPDAIVIGYSMGGRIALWHTIHKKIAPAILVLLSTNIFSPPTAQRRLFEESWLLLALKNKLEFLSKWYSQPIFESLRKHTEIFIEMFERRKKVPTALILHSMQEYSNEKIPVSLTDLLSVSIPIYTLYGSLDKKYCALYDTANLSHSYKVEMAGHALHLEAPSAVATIIKDILYGSTRI